QRDSRPLLAELRKRPGRDPQMLLGRDEGVVENLVEALAEHRFAQPGLCRLVLGLRNEPEHAAGHLDRNALVAVDPADLFDQILLALDVDAAARNLVGGTVCLRLHVRESERLQSPPALLTRDADPQHALHLRVAKLHAPALERRRVHIDSTLERRALAEL